MRANGQDEDFFVLARSSENKNVSFIVSKTLSITRTEQSASSSFSNVVSISLQSDGTGNGRRVCRSR